MNKGVGMSLQRIINAVCSKQIGSVPKCECSVALMSHLAGSCEIITRLSFALMRQ